jgi:hypothetical protein
LIAYHGMPLGGPQSDAGRFLKGRHALVSFAYPDSLPIVAAACSSFVLDNGAFTAWKQGRTVDVAAYAEWVREWHRHPGFDWCLIPDVIDGTAEENQALLYRWITQDGAGIESVPVWHLHEPVERLAWMAGAFKRVALGSSGQWATPGTQDWWARMGEAMSKVCDGQGRPRVKLHGLRMLSQRITCDLPLSSADSTNAAQNADRTAKVYKLPTTWQGAGLNADRIEIAECAAFWEPRRARDRFAELLFV